MQLPNSPLEERDTHLPDNGVLMAHKAGELSPLPLGTNGEVGESTLPSQ